MTNSFDVIIIGCGAMGSAAAYHLARRGARVLVLEQFDIGHELGSSHGKSRVIRKAYFEDPRYVPLLHSAYDLWRELERESGEKLLHLVGCLNMGPPDHVAIEGVQKSAREHRLSHEMLSADEIQRRWPAFRPAASDVGLFETEGGFVVPEQCVRIQVELARRAGATIHSGKCVRTWSAEGGGFCVRTDVETWQARSLIVAAGPWLGGVMADLGLPLRVERQVQHWFMPTDPSPFTAPRMPSFIHFVGDAAYYGIPMREREGVKVARHHAGEATTPETVNRSVTPRDVDDVRAYAARHMPGVGEAALVDSKVCLYTNTPDDHFVIDRHPVHETLFFAGGFSGHGYKFAPVIGAILADLVLEGRTSHPIEFLQAGRFCA